MSTLAKQIEWFTYWTQGKVPWSDSTCTDILSSLRSLEAQSDEVRRLRDGLKYVRLQVILMRKEGSMKQLDMEHLRDRIEEAIGSQP